jgi:hypothetical protein
VANSKVKGRVPRKGDRVCTPRIKDVFLVVDVSENPSVVNLRLLKGTLMLRGIPWTMLIFLDQEDASQAAARIVKQATESE